MARRSKRKRGQAPRDGGHERRTPASLAAAYAQQRQQNCATPVDPHAHKKLPLVSPSQTLTGVVSATWATGEATGGARFTFPTAAAANAFVADYYAGKLNLLQHLHVKLLGVEMLEHVYHLREDDVFTPRERRCLRWGYAVPPLKKPASKSDTTPWYFDVKKLASMKPAQVAHLRFVAVIRKGLLTSTTEDILLMLVHPHKCTISINRRASTRPPRRVDPARPFFFSLPNRLVFSGLMGRSENAIAMRAGVHVPCVDLGLVRKIKALAVLVGADAKTPLGDAVRVDVAFEFRAVIAFDQRFTNATEDVHLHATSHGISWCGEVTLGETNNMKLWLRGPCRDDLERVVAMLYASIDTQAVADPVLRRPFIFHADSEQWSIVQDAAHSAAKRQRVGSNQQQQQQPKHQEHATTASQRTQTTPPLASPRKPGPHFEMLPYQGYQGLEGVVVGAGFEACRLVEIPERGVQPAEARVRQLHEEKVEFYSPLVTASAPPVIIHKSFAGVVSMTWATGAPIGGVSLTFKTAVAANAFMLSFYAQKLGLPLQCTVEPIGFIDAENAVFVSEQRLSRSWRWTPNIPRLTLVKDSCKSLGSLMQKDWQKTRPLDWRSAWFFDEERIAEMASTCSDDQMPPSTTTDVELFRFVVVIMGLPTSVTEDTVMKLVHPHQCDVSIPQRDDSDAVGHVAQATGLVNALEPSLMRDNTVEFSYDPSVMRTGIHVSRSDLEEAALLKMDAINTGEIVDIPLGQPIFTVLAYEFRALIATDVYMCFRAGIAEARAYARTHGVSWYCGEASGDKRHERLWLRSASLDEVKNVVAMLEALVECEVFIDSILRRTFSSNTDWERLGKHLVAASVLDSKTCLRVSHRDRLIWIYGAKEDRYAMIHEVKMRSLSMLHNEKIERGEIPWCCLCSRQATDPSIKLAACGHTCCVECIKPALAATNRLPLRCPAERCGRRVGVHDVLQVSEDVNALVAACVDAKRSGVLASTSSGASVAQ